MPNFPMRILVLILVTTFAAELSAASAHSAESSQFITLAAQALAVGDAEAAVKNYEHAVELDPPNGDLHRQLGDAYALAAQQAGMFSKMSWAKKCRLAYEKAVELSPDNIAARQSLMSFYQMAPSLLGGGPEKVRAQADAIKKLDPVRGQVAEGKILFAEKKYAEASAAFEAALAAAPGDYAALYQLGRTAAVSGERLDRGIEALQQCLTLPRPSSEPGYEAVNWRLGNLLEKKNDIAAARHAYQASLRVNAKFEEAIDALKRLN